MEKKGIYKIGIVGAESTGKTSLCEKLAAHFNTVWVPEYAREYFNDSDIYNYTLDDLVVIAKKQISMEKEIQQKANKIIFCDTTLITLKIWAELEFEQVPSFISDNIPVIKYDHYFITDNSVPWKEDGLRQNKFSRDMLFEMNRNEVKALGAEYTVISGTEEERLRVAVKQIEVPFGAGIF